jgi:hypothetical protein
MAKEQNIKISELVHNGEVIRHKTEKSFLTYIKVSAQEHADMFRAYNEKAQP